MNIVFKVHFERNSEQSECRRFTLLRSKCEISSLRERIQSLFRIQEGQSWKLSWRDNEGDLISVTEQYELDEAIETQMQYDLTARGTNGNLVRFEAFLVESSTKAESTFPAFPPSTKPVDSFESVAEQFLNSLSSIVSPVITPRTPQPTSRPSCPFAATAQQASPRCTREFFTAQGICDISNKTLVSGGGDWFHLPGTTYDICREEWMKLSEEEGRKYVEVISPSSLGQEMSSYFPRCTRFDKSSVSIDASEATEGLHSYVGWCDATNKVLLPGCGWFHLKGHNYDLCSEAFQRLPQEQLVDFVCVQKGEDLGEDAPRYSTRKFIPRGYESIFDAFFEDPHTPAEGNQEVKREVEVPVPPQESVGDAMIHSPDPCVLPVTEGVPHSSQENVAGETVQVPDTGVTGGVPHSSQENFAGETIQAIDTDDDVSEGVLVEADVEENDGQTSEWQPLCVAQISTDDFVLPNAHWTPVVEIKNPNLAPNHVAYDLKIISRDNNYFRFPQEGIDVPIIHPSNSVVVQLELKVPGDSAGSLVRGEFQVVNAAKQPVSEPFTLSIQVHSPEEQKRKEIRGALREMGFDDNSILSVLNRCNSVDEAVNLIFNRS